MIAIVASFCAAATVFMFSAWLIRARAMHPSEERLRDLSPRKNTGGGKMNSGVLRRAPSSIPAISRWLSASGYAERWTDDLERANVKLRSGEYLLVRGFAGIVAAGLVLVIARSSIAVVIAIPVFLFAYMAPSYWLRFRTKRRLSEVNAQLVETVSLVASGLRAGFAFAQSIDVASKRMGAPIANELNRMLLDVNLGASMEDALRAMNERIGSDDVDMVVTAILIQRATGGNLAEVLEIVTETMRDRSRIQGEIKTLTSSQRLTGWILSLWPALLGLVFLAINPSMMSLLWTTGAGIVLLVIWFVLNLLGLLTIQRILNIDI